MIKYVFFDLDGTLLPMDQDLFINKYFGELVNTFKPLGYDSKKLIDTVAKGTFAMIKNDGKVSNEDVVWKVAASLYGKEILDDKDKFEDFYKTRFQDVRSSCGFNPKAKVIIDYLKSKNVKMVLATNPLFPKIATTSRIKWAGLDPNDFILYTTYENSYHCKPNLQYYDDICSLLNINPKEVLMVGNDVGEDMCVDKLGMDTFLLTDCLINRKNIDIDLYKHGDFDSLLNYLKSIFK